MALTDTLKLIADAIRTKAGTTDKIKLSDFPQAILNIPTGSSDIPFGYGGLNAVKVASYSNQFTLADTSFVKGSSASTSATTIKATVSNMYTTPDAPTLAYGDKDIVVVQTCLVKPTYGSGYTDKAKQVQYAMKFVTVFSKRKTTDTSGKTTRQAYSTSYYVNQYYNTSSALTRAVANYGFYMTPQTPSTASTSASSTYVRCSSPILYYRVSSSYLSSANIETVTECTFDWLLDVYTVDPFTSPVAQANSDIDDILINGLANT